MKIARVDGSYVVRIPDDVVAALGLKEGDEVSGAPRPWTGSAKTLEEREAALETLRSLRGLVPKGFRFDREEANARR